MNIEDFEKLAKQLHNLGIQNNELISKNKEQYSDIVRLTNRIKEL